VIRVVEHDTKGYVWEDPDCGRQARVTFLPKGQAKLVLLDGRGSNGVQKGTYTGPKDDAQLIAMTWLHNMTPGSNRITWVGQRKQSSETAAKPKKVKSLVDAV